MLIHLENGCSVTMEQIDLLARRCFQWRRYVVEDYADLLADEVYVHTEASGEWNSWQEVWGCNHCNADFDVEKELHRHLYSASHRPHAYKCPGCDDRFVQLSGLLQHVESPACGEWIDCGSGSMGKLIHWLWLQLPRQ